jgi:hypothetical protein
VSTPEHARRPGFLRDGGWVLVAGLVLGTAAAGWQVVSVLRHRGTATVGDGRTVASYRFDLSRLTVPIDLIAASGGVKDGVPALTAPASWSLADLDAAAKKRRGKILVSGDRVVGVEIGGERRAYPLRFLVWHEVVNDTLGGVPIAVTYSPLSDSVAVFRRSVDGETLELGVSGLLYQSSLLMYDRRAGAAGESLWSQVLARAVSGPAAAARLVLTTVPCSVTAWSNWRSARPDTTLLAADPRLAKEYNSDPYVSYLGSDLLRFPVDPLPPPSGPALKTPVVAVRTATGFAAITFPALAARVDAAGEWRADVDGRRLTFRYRSRPDAVTVTDDSGAAAADLYAFYFAWYATHRGDTTWLADPGVAGA